MKRILSTGFYYVTSIFSNFFRYVFHLVLLRLLAPGEYGEFSSYLSLLYILGIPTVIITNVVTKYVADFRGKGDAISINKLFYFLLNKINLVTIPVGLLLIIFSQPLAVLFKAHPLAFVILGISMFVSVFQAIINSYVLAFQKIVFLTVIGLVNVLMTIGLAVLFIKFGWGATGVVGAQILAGVVGAFISFWVIKGDIYPKIADNTIIKFNLLGFAGYSLMYAVGTSLMVSIDIIMVRIFFDAHTSGLYSSLSILGKMILFGLTPLTALVLPVAAHRHAQNGKIYLIFVKFGLVIFSLGIIGATVFSLFPVQIIKTLSGVAYIEVAGWLPYIVFTMAFFAFSQFIISYLMATNRPRATVLLLVATIVQPVLFFIFRNSFNDIIIANFVLQLGLFLALVLYIVRKDFFAGFKICMQTKDLFQFVL